jgi:ACS family sodium-dependent inorganic phosphate cotransporter
MFRRKSKAAAAAAPAPEQTAEQKAAAAAQAAAAEEDRKRPVPWGLFLRSPAVWAIIVAHFCFNWGYYTLLAWLPSYFEMALGEWAGRGRQAGWQAGRVSGW